MKKKIVCRKLRASKLIPSNMTDRDIGWIKSIIAPKSTWYRFGQIVQLLNEIPITHEGQE